MSVAIIGMGVPGSGKTTFLKAFAERHGLAYINKDAIRAEMLGDVRDQSKNREIWLESERRTNEALARGESVVLDSTYAERWKREQLVASLKKRGATKVLGAYFDIPFERALRQNQNADRTLTVSGSQMRWFQDQFDAQPPDLTEGFDALYTFDQLERLNAELP